ncbi:alginate export family protein [Sphingobium sp.]|uniref:alginate export family protein n=1 Tax=Sphingobium sp. TaxID=1912891 RepID=UPI0028BF4176|nr:alginate export family protein [Sphingobium sp.]
MIIRPFWGLAALACASPALAETPRSADYPVAAQGDGAVVNGYNLSRWAEDWRVYRDPAKRDDLLDRLKYLPLDPDGDIYLTLSGEARLRMNLTSNPQLIEGPEQRQDIVRLVAGADLHVGDHLRFYGEVAHGQIGGKNIGTPSGTFSNSFVYQQYFAEAKGRIDNVDLGIRYGRQEFTDGPNLLISQRDNNTIRFVLNGTRAWARTPTMRATLFDFETTDLGNGGLGDDVPDRNRRFSGISAGFVLPQHWLGGSKLFFDPFFWRRRNRVGTWGGVVAPAVRYYAGARFWGDIGRLNLDWTLVHQYGEFQDRPINAWQAFFAQNWRLGEGKAAPRIGLHADYGSGGGGYDKGTLRNAYAPYGNNVYFSYGLFLTATNMMAIAPNISFSPTDRLRASVEYQFTWRDDEKDAVYRANYTPYVGTEKVAGKAVARLLRAQLVYSLAPRLTLTMRTEYLRAGTVLRRAGYANSAFLGSWISFRF